MIGELFAFVVTDSAGVEGVLRWSTPIGTQPMIADSIERLKEFLPHAMEAVRGTGCVLDVARFVRASMPRENR